MAVSVFIIFGTWRKCRRLRVPKPQRVQEDKGKKRSAHSVGLGGWTGVASKLTNGKDDADQNDVHTKVAAGSHLCDQALELGVVCLELPSNLIHLLLNVVDDGVLAIKLWLHEEAASTPCRAGNVSVHVRGAHPALHTARMLLLVAHLLLHVPRDLAQPGHSVADTIKLLVLPGLRHLKLLKQPHPRTQRRVPRAPCIWLAA